MLVVLRRVMSYRYIHGKIVLDNHVGIATTGIFMILVWGHRLDRCLPRLSKQWHHFQSWRYNTTREASNNNIRLLKIDKPQLNISESYTNIHVIQT